MPAPTTTDQLFEHIRKSGLLSPARLDECAAGLPSGAPPRAVLDRLVGDGLLTPFQAERLAAGKYKGFVLGGYVILDRIGGGGMGQVYLAEHAAMRRHVAVKVLAAAGAPETVARERFLREARAAAGLNHPNIIRVFDLRQDRHVLYLVMEYVEGVSLHHLIARTGPLDVRAAAHYVRQVAAGLQHAHENGLVHRDIKPANLLLGRDGGVRVLDLGLVRSVAENSKLTSRIDKTILGTADYLAPEQAMDSSRVDIRADVYSLGATFYCLLAGHPMFPEGRTAQKLMWQQMKDPTLIRELRPEVPDGLAGVVHRALRKDPADRYQTPAEFAAAVASWATGPVPPPDPDVCPPPPPRWAGAIPAGGTGPAPTVSCAVIDLPPFTADRKSESVTPVLDDRPQVVPRLIPPDCRTPILGSGSVLASGFAAAEPVRPAGRRARIISIAAAAGLLAAGFVAGILALWLTGLAQK